MTADPDEDALAWAGDSDPSHVEGQTATAKKKPTGVGKVRTVEVQEEPKPATSSFALVTYGILAGAYLIYTLGWVIGIQKNSPTLADPFANFMYHLGEYLAIGSAAVWFAAVFLLTRDRKLVVRLLWLVLGLLVVIPWPFLLGGV
ncbi:MAG: hypothetical protein ABJB03_09985 [Rhodoglobus sp.]